MILMTFGMILLLSGSLPIRKFFKTTITPIITDAKITARIAETAVTVWLPAFVTSQPLKELLDFDD